MEPKFDMKAKMAMLRTKRAKKAAPKPKKPVEGLTVAKLKAAAKALDVRFVPDEQPLPEFKPHAFKIATIADFCGLPDNQIILAISALMPEILKANRAGKKVDYFLWTENQGFDVHYADADIFA